MGGATTKHREDGEASASNIAVWACWRRRSKAGRAEDGTTPTGGATCRCPDEEGGGLDLAHVGNWAGLAQPGVVREGERRGGGSELGREKSWAGPEKREGGKVGAGETG
uniref:Uncharacterized protein n=1 Tax=Oryza brachyantha TaxID=4533 RepID=J3LC38_ORYBR